MSSIAGPYGLRTNKYLGDTPFSSGMQTYPILQNQATGFYFGDPVGIQAGQVVPLSATPSPGNLVLGIFYGAEFQDPIRGFVNSQFLPANIIQSGAWNVRIKVMDYPFLVMRVQADGPVNYDSIGQGADLSNFGNGSIWTGNSQVSLLSASIGSGAAVRIYDLVVDAAPSPGAGSMPGDPFTECLVVWNFGVHRYMNAS